MKFLPFLVSLLIFPTIARADTAVFAGGCFWCMESEFQDLKGVSDVTSGYAGGEGPAPTYEEVSSGTTGFKEAIEVTYDPQTVSYEKLLKVFWSNVDPLDDKGQFCDRGTQYVAAIFTTTDEEKAAAEASLKDVETKLGQTVTAQIVPKTTFYPAEDYHQDYYKKEPDRFEMYKNSCGRERTLEKMWKGREKP